MSKFAHEIAVVGLLALIVAGISLAGCEVAKNRPVAKPVEPVNQVMHADLEKRVIRLEKQRDRIAAAVKGYGLNLDVD